MVGAILDRLWDKTSSWGENVDKVLSEGAEKIVEACGISNGLDVLWQHNTEQRSMNRPRWHQGELKVVKRKTNSLKIETVSYYEKGCSCIPFLKE